MYFVSYRLQEVQEVNVQEVNVINLEAKILFFPSNHYLLFQKAQKNNDNKQLQHLVSGNERKGRDIFKHNISFIPTNYYDSHWLAIVVLNAKNLLESEHKPTYILQLDSLYNKEFETVINVVIEWLKIEAKHRGVNFNKKRIHIIVPKGMCTY